MRPSKVPKDCFGPYHSSSTNLQPLDEQYMVFREGDSGPCYLSEEERRKRKYDVNTGEIKEKEIPKCDLIKLLQTSGIKEPKGKKNKLQEIAKGLNLPIRKQEKIIKEGWLGKPKGSLQLLYKRGWINPN